MLTLTLTLDGASANASASSTSLISSLYFLEYLSSLCSLPFPTLDDRYVSSRAILSMSRTLQQEQQESMLTVVDAEAELQRGDSKYNTENTVQVADITDLQ